MAFIIVSLITIITINLQEADFEYRSKEYVVCFKKDKKEVCKTAVRGEGDIYVIKE